MSASAPSGPPLLGEGVGGRGVVCTGAAGGIGRAVVALFAQAGGRVFGVDRPGQGLESVMDRLPGAGHGWADCDLSEVDTAIALPKLAEESIGDVSVLVHCAGVLVRQPLPDVSEETWDVQMDVSLKPAFFLSRAFADHLVAHRRSGSLVLFGSQAWWTGGFGGSIVYAAAKGGVTSIMRGLARTYGPRGITVNAIAPGSIDTSMLHAGMDAALLAQNLEATPLRRLGRPDEVAAAALFLASENAGFITGTVLNVSGGWLIY